jgi:hypothetical protein
VSKEWLKKGSHVLLSRNKTHLIRILEVTILKETGAEENSLSLSVFNLKKCVAERSCGAISAQLSFSPLV